MWDLLDGVDLECNRVESRGNLGSTTKKFFNGAVEMSSNSAPLNTFSPEAAQLYECEGQTSKICIRSGESGERTMAKETRFCRGRFLFKTDFLSILPIHKE